MIVGQIQKGEKMGRTLNEDDVLKEINRWIGYLDEDMITRIKIGIKKLQSIQPEQCEDAVSKADMLETYADLYDVFEDNDQIRKELNKVYDKLNALPSVTPKTEQRWIPCSERLPDESGEYLCTLVGVHSIGLPTECGYELPNRGMISGWSTCEADGFKFLRDDEVIAWMPLPEPYREEGGE